MNDYALRFPVPVPGNLSQLEFTWQNLRPQQPLKYRIEMTVDNPEAMLPPTLDIPSTGESSARGRQATRELGTTRYASSQAHLDTHTHTDRHALTCVDINKYKYTDTYMYVCI